MRVLMALWCSLALGLHGQPPGPTLAERWGPVQALLDRAGDRSPELPAEDGAAIRAFQRASAAWVEAQLRAGASEAGLSDAFLAALPREARTERGPTLQVEARDPRWPAWRTVRLACPVPCGTTESVLLLERAEEGWHLRLADLWPGTPGKDVSPGREHVALAFALTPRGPRLVMADTPPWCTSCWSEVRVRVLAPGDDPEAPRVLHHWKAGTYRCVDVPLALSPAGKAKVRLTYYGEAGPLKLFAKRTRVLRVP